MSTENSKTVDKTPTDESLIFELSDATEFKPGLFDRSTISDPEIDLLAVKAINRSSPKNDIPDDKELDIEHGMMILHSHRKQLAELEELEEGKVSNKKIAVVMIILLFFVTFIVAMFLVSKLISNKSPNRSSSTKMYYDNGGITGK